MQTLWAEPKVERIMTNIRILCVHGLGDHRLSDWESTWQDAVEAAVGNASGATFEFRFCTYDPIFEDTDISFGETMKAVAKLAKSGVLNVGRRSRNIFGRLSDRLRWTAGYVVAWVEDDGFQAQTRKLILDEVRAFQPDVILAHSLGSLVTYNALSHDDAQQDEEIAHALSNVQYVTFGSQIGNPFVLGNLTHGRVQDLPVQHWHHLYNRHDDVFTAQLRLSGVSNFTQLLTPFDEDGIGDHSAPGYIGHETTINSFWNPLLDTLAPSGSRVFRSIKPWERDVGDREPRRRAVLIGIDDYPDPSQRLYGCVNDVFSMSAALQDCGFDAEEIRTCLNHRATASEIISRFSWLVQDAKDGDELVFYYSGHGARVPEYGIFEEPDRLTETLVPYDFNWTPETSVSDEQIYEHYAQLPYGVRLILIFDCCHAGGMHRQSAARTRGIAPPDDIRHRELRWHTEEKMWVERDFEPLNEDFGTQRDRKSFFGDNAATIRMGRAAPLRVEKRSAYKKEKTKRKGPVGPFLPMVIDACQEQELSYEYRHGVTSFGAFTYCLTKLLREKKNLTFESLVEHTAERLRKLGYEQTPDILGPTALISAPIPFETGNGSSDDD